MKFVNENVVRDLESGRRIRLDLGCGPRPKEGHYGLDHVELPGVDIVASLEERLTEIPDNSVDNLVTRHTLEHIVQFLQLIKEIHRIVVPGGTVEIETPHFSNPYYYSDPTHVRFFGLYTFHYFSDDAKQHRKPVPNFYISERFEIQSIRFTLIPTILMNKPVRRLTTRIVNSSMRIQDWYERAMCRSFPIDSIRYVLKVKK